jgi:hypothetical protein
MVVSVLSFVVQMRTSTPSVTMCDLEEGAIAAGADSGRRRSRPELVPAWPPLGCPDEVWLDPVE